MDVAAPIVFYNIVTSVVHGMLFVLGLVLVKHSKSWLTAGAIVVATVLFSVAMTVATFFLQGSERAWSMLSPGGELFVVMFIPVLINACILTSFILFTAYGLFVEPGNSKNV